MKPKKKRIAFVCTENSCRSQIAEALAKRLCNKPNIEFVSMGTHPASEVDPKALEYYKRKVLCGMASQKIFQPKNLLM